MQDLKLVGRALRIVCLHTADSNIAVFDKAVRIAARMT